MFVRVKNFTIRIWDPCCAITKSTLILTTSRCVVVEIVSHVLRLFPSFRKARHNKTRRKAPRKMLWVWEEQFIPPRSTYA